ncbi:MAG: HepT-like ribonuclease domain-containing protein [Patescibacteria group bacterium]
MSKLAIEYIRHILDEIAFLTNQAAALPEDQFMRDEVLQRAFSRSLEIIGEAVKNIPVLRDKLIHLSLV